MLNLGRLIDWAGQVRREGEILIVLLIAWAGGRAGRRGGGAVGVAMGRRAGMTACSARG